MKIKSIELTDGRREKPMKIVVSAESKEINAKVLHVRFNEVDWYFKSVRAVCSGISPDVSVSEIIAESYGYGQRIRRDMEDVNDFGQMIGLVPDIITDQETLKNLSDKSRWC